MVLVGLKVLDAELVGEFVAPGNELVVADALGQGERTDPAPPLARARSMSLGSLVTPSSSSLVASFTCRRSCA